MRLWHYKLIPALPNAMLVSQWRECIAIKRQWKKGTLKHRLVAYVKDYDRELFYNYTTRVCYEINVRGIRYQEKYLHEIMNFCGVVGNSLYPFEEKNYPEHNNRYLIQCYYNLEEKYDRGIITLDEMLKIQDLMREVLK